MLCRGNCYDDGVDGRINKKLFQFTGSSNPVLFLGFGQRRRIFIADASQRTELIEITNQVPAPISGAYDCDFRFQAFHISPCDFLRLILSREEIPNDPDNSLLLLFSHCGKYGKC